MNKKAKLIEDVFKENGIEYSTEEDEIFDMCTVRVQVPTEYKNKTVTIKFLVFDEINYGILIKMDLFYGIPIYKENITLLEKLNSLNGKYRAYKFFYDAYSVMAYYDFPSSSTAACFKKNIMEAYGRAKRFIENEYLMVMAAAFLDDGNNPSGSDDADNWLPF